MIQSTETLAAPHELRPKLLIVSTHPAQTYSELYREISQRCRIRLHVLFARDTTGGFFDPGFNRNIEWNVDLVGGYSVQFLQASGRRALQAGGVKNVRLEIPTLAMLRETWRQVRDYRPDAILIPGHGNLWYLFIWFICRQLGIPYIIRGTGVIQRPSRSLLSKLRDTVARAQVSGAAAFCYIGIANYYFGVSHGAASFVFSPYAISTRLFSGHEFESETRKQQLTKLGLDPATPVVTFSGKLQPWKRPQDLIRAVAECSLPVQAIIIGDGPMREELEDLASDLGATVHFAGFVNQSEMPAWYALGDIFVLPSGPGGDSWGLAANEALAMGLTPILSDAVPSWPDLAWGIGGTYPVGDTKRLADCIATSLSRRKDPDHHRALSNLSQRYSLENAARGIEDTVLQVSRSAGAVNLRDV